MSKNKNKYKNGSISLSSNYTNFNNESEEDLVTETVELTESSSQKEQQALPFDYREKNIANAIAILAAFFFVLGVGYFAYKYFINSNFGFKKNEANQITKEAAFTIRDGNSEQETYPDIMNEQENNPYIQKELESAMNSQARLENTTNSTDGKYLVWTAIDYKQGDIGKGKHVVQEGDTLWEIAEAVYGDGSMWTNILAANADSVGFLANGQQALIYTGQTITIP